MFANFNYEASPAAVIIGVVLSMGLVLALGATTRPWASAVGSGIGCGAIAFGVWACGRGDVVGLFYLVIAVPAAAVAGGFAGYLSALVIRGRNKAGDDKQGGVKDHEPADS